MATEKEQMQQLFAGLGLEDLMAGATPPKTPGEAGDAAAMQALLGDLMQGSLGDLFGMPSSPTMMDETMLVCLLEQQLEDLNHTLSALKDSPLGQAQTEMLQQIDFHLCSAQTGVDALQQYLETEAPTPTLQKKTLDLQE